MDILTKELLIEHYPAKIRIRLKCLGARLCETDTCLNEYKKHLRDYEKKVHKLRNSFEHDYHPVSIEDLHQAYKICFGLFWVLSQMRPQKMKKKFYFNIKSFFKF